MHRILEFYQALPRSLQKLHWKTQCIWYFCSNSNWYISDAVSNSFVKILTTDSSGSMNDSKWPAISLNALSMFENALTMFWNDFEMDLQRISVPLKNIANVSKRNRNALKCIFNGWRMHCNEKTLQRYFR